MEHWTSHPEVNHPVAARALVLSWPAAVRANERTYGAGNDRDHEETHEVNHQQLMLMYAAHHCEFCPVQSSNGVLCRHSVHFYLCPARSSNTLLHSKIFTQKQDGMLVRIE